MSADKDALELGFHQLQREGYVPLLTAGGEPLHDPALVDTLLFKHSPTHALAALLEKADGLAIGSTFIVAVESPVPIAEWDQPVRPAWNALTPKPVPSFDSIDGSGNRTYLYGDAVGVQADLQVGEYRVRCFNGLRDVLAVPLPSQWVTFGRSLRSLPFDLLRSLKEAVA